MNNIKTSSNKIKFADYKKDSPIITLIISILYGISIYLYFNFRLNPEWGGGSDSDICDESNMSGCTISRAKLIEKEKKDPKWNSWWEENKLHVLDILFCIGAAASFIVLIISWINVFGKDPFGEFKIFKSIILFSSYLFLIAGIIAGVVFFISSTPTPLTILINIMNIGVILFLIVFLGKTFSQWFHKNSNSKLEYNSLSGFIYLALLYLPCKLYDLIDWIKNQWKITSKTDFIILGISLVLIATRIAIPFIWNYFRDKIWGQNVLLRGTLPLQYKKDIGTFQGLDPYTVKHDDCFNYNYSISFKIWINPQGDWTSVQYNNANILDFGQIILVKYSNNYIEFIAKTTRRNNIHKNITVYKVKINDIPLQKWNDFVINYNGGTLDIFLNGTLESSTPKISPIMGYHAVTVGDNNGIYGGIKDVVYFKHMLNLNDIRNLSKFT